MPEIPRKPGSQVAPGQKPLFRQGTTASTHSRVPIDQATAGKLYRVRDKADAQGNCTVWAENLPYDEAIKVKERVVTQRKSKTARIEEMPQDELEFGELAAAEQADAIIVARSHAEVAAQRLAQAEAEYVHAPTMTTMTKAIPQPRTGAPVVQRQVPAPTPKQIIPTRVGAPAPTYNLDGSVDYTKLSELELVRALADNPRRWARAFWQTASARGIKLAQTDEQFILTWFEGAISSRPRAGKAAEGDVVVDPYLEEVAAKARAAAAPIARQAQIRADQLKKPKPVVQSAPPTPPPSPLSDELVDVGEGPAELPPEDTLGSADISDLSAEVGGGPSDADRTRAKAQADADVAEMTRAARNAYDEATILQVENGPWPLWENLGEFEHAAWRYYVSQGGQPPALTKAPRKVSHAMGSAS
jgi:hypothetical protein